MNSKTAFSFENISFSYTGTRDVLASIDIIIPKNSITAVLGPNGTGKTTLLHLALGWLKPKEGHVLLFGRDLAGYAGRDRGRTIGLLPQKEPASFDYTVLEYVLLGRAPYLKPLEVPGPADIRIATNALNSIGIPEMKQRLLPTLSGGETQLVLLSRSLAQDPDILLLDEPTNHLDLKNRREMVRLLRELNKKGKTIVFTTHDPELASILADHLILMGPNWIESGPFPEFFREEKLSRVYGIPVKLKEIEGHSRVLWE